MPAPSDPPPPPAGHVAIRAPEQISFTFEIAGIGSRGLAALADSVVLFLLLTFLSGALVMVLRGTLAAASKAWAVAIVLISLYTLVWGYFVYFESRWHGQTPGKRLLGLRVVQDNGIGIGFLEAAIRNVVRAVDFLPGFFSLGLLVMFFNRRAKRLGDWAAGTVVIKERRHPLQSLDPRAETILRRAPSRLSRRADAPALTARQYEWLAQYLDRRTGLTADARLRLARALAGPLLREDGVSEDEIDRLSLEDCENWLKSRVAEIDSPAAPAGASRRLHEFVQRRQPAWQRLVQLLDRTQGAPWSALAHAELRELGTLYRRTTADFAYAQLHFPGTETLSHLNQLVSRGHNAVYQRAPVTLYVLWRFFTHAFPAAVRGNLGAIGLAAAVFALAGLFGYFLIVADPDFATLFLSPEALQGHIEDGRLWTDDLVTVMPSSITSARILTNNVTVALLSFALGAAAGIGTLVLLGFNGLMLGVVTGACARHGLAGSLWSFIAAHGPLELAGLFFAAGAGLTLAGAVLRPGEQSRADALRETARPAVVLVIGALPILFLAGFVEGFVSTSQTLPAWSKILTGAASALGLVAWLARSGRTVA